MMNFPRAIRLVLFGASAASALAIAACSDDTDSGGDGDGDMNATGGSGTGGSGTGGDAGISYCGPADSCPYDATGVDLTTPVSFRTDIYNAFFLQSCTGGAGCHAQAAITGFGFGTQSAPLDDAGITALIEEFKNKESPAGGAAVRNVVPGDWQNSFLMLVLDGCQNMAGLTSCTNTILSACSEPCGDGMPQSEGETMTNPVPFPLPAEQRNKVRAWIAQGAPDN